MNEDDFIELTAQNVFLTVTDDLKSTNGRVYLSKACFDLLESNSTSKFVKILVNKNAIKIKLEKNNSSAVFRIEISKQGYGSIRRASNIIQQLKNIGWTFSDGRKFEGEKTEDGFIFYKERLLKVKFSQGGKQSC